MAVVDFADWLTDFTRPGISLYVKRLSANDTQATNTNQAGPYIPRDFLFAIFPQLNQPGAVNPDVWFHLYLDSHDDHQRVRAVWYNNILREGSGKRNETRLTNLGGQSSALLDPVNRGAVTVFAFVQHENDVDQEAHVRICRTEAEEQLVEDRIGPVHIG